MPTYTDPPAVILRQLDAVLNRWHADLVEAGVSYLIQLAHAARDKNDEPRGPALKWGGSPAAAKVGIINIKDRQAKLADVRVFLDADRWDEFTSDEQEAILHHELMHVEICRTKPKKVKKKGVVTMEGGGEIISDDLGRPKLKLRPHDFLMGGFFKVMEHCGDAAQETKHAEAMHRWVQKSLYGNTEESPADTADQSEPVNKQHASGKKSFVNEVVGYLESNGVAVETDVTVQAV